MQGENFGEMGAYGVCPDSGTKNRPRISIYPFPGSRYF